MFCFCFRSLLCHPHKRVWKKDVHPITSVSDTGPIESELEGKEQEFLDLAHMFLYVTMQRMKSDGSELDSGAKVGPVNLFLHSLFGQLDISLNGKTISDGSSTYLYQACLETLLSYGEEAKSTHSTSSLFYKDIASKMDKPDLTKSNADVNLGLEKRASFTRESKVVDMIGRFHGDIFNQEKYLLDIVKVHLSLHRSKKPFCLMCAETSPNFKVKVLDAVLKARKLHISSNAYLGITTALNEDTAKYPLRRVVIKSYSISAGSVSRSVDHMFRDVIPQRVVIGMVDDAFKGEFGKNPSSFQNYKMTLCGLLKNNELIPNEPY